MQGIVFRHDAERLHEALGISDERAVELSEILARVWVASDTVSEMVEKIISDDGLSDVEKVYALVKLGKVVGAQLLLRGGSCG